MSSSQEVDKSIHWVLEHLRRDNDLLYFLHVVSEHSYDVIGGDAAETIISEDEDAERRAVSGGPAVAGQLKLLWGLHEHVRSYHSRACMMSDH